MERLTNCRRVGPILGETNGERSAEGSVTNDKRRESQGLSLHSLLPNNLLSCPPIHKCLLSTSAPSKSPMASPRSPEGTSATTKGMCLALVPILPHKRCVVKESPDVVVG